MSSKQWDVLGFGAIAVDDLLYVGHYPQLDEKVPVIRKQRQGGGNTATALVAVARQGSKAAYCSVLGNDDLSVFSISELKREGIDTSPIFYQESARPFFAVVLVDTSNGKRSIAYSGDGVTEPVPAQVTIDMISQTRVVFIDHKAGQIGPHVAKLARQLGIPMVGDFEGEIDEHLRTLIEQVDHLIVGEDFAREYTGKSAIDDMVTSLSGSSRACSVVTAGEKGCWFSIKGQAVQHFPAYKVQVVDTTGCGDVFHGAYAAAISRGEDSLYAIQIASATAALKATRPGGRSGIPDLQTVKKFIDENH